MLVSVRLKEERNRLGLSQHEFGDLVGVGKTTIINWEKGLGAPDAVQLSVLMQHSVDVVYIVTGVRVSDIQYVTGGMNSSHSATDIDVAHLLSERETKLLDNYRASPEHGKRAVEAASVELAKSQKKKA